MYTSARLVSQLPPCTALCQRTSIFFICNAALNLSACFYSPLYVLLQSHTLLHLEFVTLFLHVPLVHVPNFPTCFTVLKHDCHTSVSTILLHLPHVFYPFCSSCCLWVLQGLHMHHVLGSPCSAYPATTACLDCGSIPECDTASTAAMLQLLEVATHCLHACEMYTHMRQITTVTWLTVTLF